MSIDRLKDWYYAAGASGVAPLSEIDILKEIYLALGGSNPPPDKHGILNGIAILKSGTVGKSQNETLRNIYRLNGGDVGTMPFDRYQLLRQIALSESSTPPPDPGDFTPSFDFSDSRNSQYVAAL